jgi:hypothetical protein
MRPREATLDFLDQCRAARSGAEIAELLFSEMSKCGIVHVACASHVDPLKPPRGSVMMCNYPMSWQTRFSEKKYAGSGQERQARARSGSHHRRGGRMRDQERVDHSHSFARGVAGVVLAGAGAGGR